MIWNAFKDWPTTISGTVTAVAGFVLFSPDLFTSWPWLIEVAKYIAAGGLVAFGVSAQSVRKNGK